jgi:hypothetical protein
MYSETPHAHRPENSQAGAGLEGNEKCFRIETIGAKIGSLGVAVHQQKITQIEILSGWKDIANYLGQGVRTVQRYERDLGLPVRRTAGRCKGAVIATKAEIDAWISARPLRQGLSRSLPASNDTEIFEAFRNQLADLHRLRVEAAQLRTEMTASRQALKMSIELLHETLRGACPAAIS